MRLSHRRKRHRPKREAPKQVPEEFEEVEEPKKKKLKKAMTPAEKYAHFLQKSAVRGKAVKVAYFNEQGLQTPLSPVLGVSSTSSGPLFDTLLQYQTRLKEEIYEVK